MESNVNLWSTYDVKVIVFLYSNYIIYSFYLSKKIHKYLHIFLCKNAYYIKKRYNIKVGKCKGGIGCATNNEAEALAIWQELNQAKRMEIYLLI